MTLVETAQCYHLCLFITVGVPLVFESLSWEHGVMVGAAVKSETTSAAEFKGRQYYLIVQICLQ